MIKGAKLTYKRGPENIDNHSNVRNVELGVPGMKLLCEGCYPTSSSSTAYENLNLD